MKSVILAIILVTIGIVLVGAGNRELIYGLTSFTLGCILLILRIRKLLSEKT